MRIKGEYTYTSNEEYVINLQSLDALTVACQLNHLVYLIVASSIPYLIYVFINCYKDKNMYMHVVWNASNKN